MNTEEAGLARGVSFRSKDRGALYLQCAFFVGPRRTGKEENMDKKTPLYDRHVALKGKMVSFGGYLMPVQYDKGILAEHMAVRTEAGISMYRTWARCFSRGRGRLRA